MISSSLASNESGTVVIDDVEDNDPPDGAESSESGTLVIEEGETKMTTANPPT